VFFCAASTAIERNVDLRARPSAGGASTFPVEMPSATRIATVSGRCSRRLWHSTQVAARGGVGAHITQRVDSG